jgi:RimJ/RimL family protein N-acetyltransferase
VLYSPLTQWIETERLVLRQEELSDDDWFAALLNERGGGSFTVEDARKRIATTTDQLASVGLGVLVLTLKPELTPIGYCAIVVGRGTIDEPELAYELLAREHGKGYATEASKALMEAAFATGRTRIWSSIRPRNVASINVIEKLGFHRDHTTTDSEGELVWFVSERPRSP